MNKEIFIVILLIVLIIIGHYFTQNYTKNFFSEFSEDLNQIEEKIFASEYENLESEIKNLQQKWKEKYNVFAFYIEHDELEKVETQLISIGANIKTSNYDKCVDEIDKCIFILEHIEDKDSLELVNIF